MRGSLLPLPGSGRRNHCQIAFKRDPLFASKNDPLWMAESRAWTGLGAVMRIGLLERLECREGVARPEFQPLQQLILFPAGLGSAAVFEAPGVVARFDDIAVMGQAIEHGGRHLGVAEDLGPVGEGEIGGD